MRGGLSPPQQQYEFMRGGGGQIAQILCSNSMKSPKNIINGLVKSEFENLCLVTRARPTCSFVNDNPLP